jgi:hypothetical protein
MCACVSVFVCVFFCITLPRPQAIWDRRVHHYTQHFITHLINLCARVFEQKIWCSWQLRKTYLIFYISLHLLKDRFQICNRATQDNAVGLYSVRGRSEKPYTSFVRKVLRLSLWKIQNSTSQLMLPVPFEVIPSALNTLLPLFLQVLSCATVPSGTVAHTARMHTWIHDMLPHPSHNIWSCFYKLF